MIRQSRSERGILARCKPCWCRCCWTRLEGIGNELGPIVATVVRRCRVEAGQLFQHRHHIFGHSTPPCPDRQAEPAGLVDHIEELQSPPIGGGVNWKSIAHTWCRCSAWGHRTDPSAGLAHFCMRGVGRWSPSSRQSWCTRLWFISESSRLSKRYLSAGPSECARLRFPGSDAGA